MDTSIFLARLFGIYFIIVGMVYLLRKEFLYQVAIDFYQNKALIAISAILSLFVGLLVILSHNIWEFNWKILITLIGYISLLKGILNLFFTDQAKKLSRKFVEGETNIYIGSVVIAIGCYLFAQGFFLNQ